MIPAATSYCTIFNNATLCLYKEVGLLTPICLPTLPDLIRFSI